MTPKEIEKLDLKAPDGYNLMPMAPVWGDVKDDPVVTFYATPKVGLHPVKYFDLENMVWKNVDYTGWNI